MNEQILNKYELSKFRPIKIKESVLRTKSNENVTKATITEKAVDQAYDIVAALLETSEGRSSQME